MEVGRSEWGEKNEKDERRERVSQITEIDQIREVGIMGIRVFFFSLNINGRAGGYPLDKKHKTRGPPESQIRKIIKSLSIYVYTHEQAAKRMGQAGRFSRVFAHPY